MHLQAQKREEYDPVGADYFIFLDALLFGLIIFKTSKRNFIFVSLKKNRLKEQNI